MKQPGVMVLERVAARYRNNPSSWCHDGWGHVGGAEIEKDPHDDKGLLSTIGPEDPCCIDVAIMVEGAKLGGDVVIGQARRMVYNHLQVAHKRKKIWSWNDEDDRTVEQVVAMLEAATAQADSSRRRDLGSRIASTLFAAVMAMTPQQPKVLAEAA